MVMVSSQLMDVCSFSCSFMRAKQRVGKGHGKKNSFAS